MNRRTFLSIATGTLIGLAVAIPAEASSWHHLGSRHVRPLIDHDTIHVGAVSGPFDKIKLKVRGNGLFVYDLKVVYGNGVVDDIPVRWHFAQGTTSRTIDLRRNYRFIKEIRMTYGKAINGRGRTVVQVFGRR